MGITTKKTDGQIQEDVLRELKWDTRIRATEVGVEVRSGVVALSGTVDSWAQRLAAQKAAHRVAGVLDVANEIRVHVPGSLERSDADIAKAVRLALEWDVRLPHEQIRSTVSNGCVTLEGTVSYLSQREDAAKAVRYLAGVKAIINAIAVAPPHVVPSEVRKAITDALERQVQREAGHIEVKVVDDCVTVSGAVHSWAERRAVLGAAGATPGVRAVEDRLRVESWT